jgi:hypothetical protein
MIPEFLLEKYVPEVCQIMMVGGRVKGENIRGKTSERQQMMVAQIIISLPHFGSKLNNKVFWSNNMEKVKLLLKDNHITGLYPIEKKPATMNKTKSL